MLGPASSSSKTGFTKLLILSQPWLLSLGQHTFCTVINEVAENDENEGDGVKIVDVVMKDLSTNDNSPECACQQTNVEESSGGHAEDNWCQGVEDEQQQSIADNIADDLSVPVCFLDGTAIENGSLYAVDEHAPECELANNFVHGSFRDQELLECVAESVKSLSEETEEISFEGVGWRIVVLLSNVVTYFGYG